MYLHTNEVIACKLLKIYGFKICFERFKLFFKFH